MKRLFAMIRIGVRPMFLIGLNGAVFAYAMFQGGFVSWFLFYGVFAISLLSISVILFSISGMRVERMIEGGRLRAGDTLKVTLRIRFDLWNPFAYLQIEEQMPEKLRNFREKKAAFYFFSWRRTLDFTYSYDLLPRGEHRFETVELLVGDMFGFYEKKMFRSLPETVLVYPRFEPLEHWVVHSSKENGGSIPLSQSFEEELTLAGVRHYVPGDRLMSIDWKQTARQNQLMTKEFDGEHEREVFLAFFPSHSSESHQFERSVELAAAFIEYFSLRKLPIGLAADDEYYLPHAKQEHYEQLLHYFVKVQLPNEANAEPMSLAKRSEHSMYVFIMTKIEQRLITEVAELIQNKNHLVICYVQPKQTLADNEREQVYAWRRQGVRVYCFFAESEWKKRG